MKSELKIGDAAPKFTAIAVGGNYGEGREITISELKGRAVVLYFYPKDDTPGCTKQACALRDEWAQLEEKALIFGVSADSVESHRKFIEKHKLPFPLISDADKKIIEAYGVWVEKSMYGNKYMGIERSTFVISETGKIAAVFRKVQPAQHLKNLLSVL